MKVSVTVVAGEVGTMLRNESGTRTSVVEDGAERADADETGTPLMKKLVVQMKFDPVIRISCCRAPIAPVVGLMEVKAGS